MSRLSPNFLKVLPTCPLAGEGYGFRSASNPDAYTITCTAHRGRYTSAKGLELDHGD